jgi:multicomponent Na+:H+ antiporter subunit B
MKFDSLILRTTVRYLLALLILFSVFVFERGHNEPGGGFIAGLVAAAAFALYSIAYGVQETRRALRIEPRVLIGLGLLTALASGMIGMAFGGAFLSGLWGSVQLAGGSALEVGTPILFDIGVYLTVLGVTLTIVFALEEAE